MKTAELLDLVLKAGVIVELFPPGKLKIAGDEQAVKRWIPELSAHKAELVKHLTESRDRPPARVWTKGNPFVCPCGHATGWQLNGVPLCPVCFHKLHGIDPPEGQPETDPPRQVVCQAFEHSGVLMATASKHCLEWQCHYCKGCELLTVQ